ncbi:MAG: hypothetical protein ABI224_08415 [Acetobacteraceae bacterium]
MRALKAATIVMGVLIVVGTAVLIAVIVKRASAPAPAAGGFVPAAASFAAVLHEPAGTHITGLAAIDDALALSLQGGGSDRVVLIDPRSGEPRGRITLAP